MVITILTFVWATKHFRRRQPVVVDVVIVSAAAAAAADVVLVAVVVVATGGNRIPAKIARSAGRSVGRLIFVCVFRVSSSAACSK